VDELGVEVHEYGVFRRGPAFDRNQKRQGLPVGKADYHYVSRQGGPKEEGGDF
jgi:hypothetical protein